MIAPWAIIRIIPKTLPESLTDTPKPKRHWDRGDQSTCSRVPIYKYRQRQRLSVTIGRDRCVMQWAPPTSLIVHTVILILQKSLQAFVIRIPGLAPGVLVQHIVR